MKGNTLGILVVVALVPLLIFAAIVAVTGYRPVSWQPPVLWSHLFGTDGSGITLIASDSSSVYAQGYDFQAGSGNEFLNKYDTSGTLLWSRIVGVLRNGYYNVTFNGVAVGSDGIYLSGVNSSDPLGEGILLKYDPLGNFLWEQTMVVGLNGGLKTISVLQQRVYVTGVSPPITNQSFTGRVTWVRAYDTSGNVLWTREYTNETTFFDSVYAYGSGVYVSYYGINSTQNLGPFLLKFDTNGSLLWNHQADGIGSTGDSTGLYLFGQSLSKYDFDGNRIWASQVSSPDMNSFGGEVYAGSSGVYLSLTTGGGREFLEKYDSGGHSIWTLQMQTARTDLSGQTAFRVSVGPGVVFVAGSVLSDSRIWAMIGAVSPDASLIFFYLNPPWSFLLLGGTVGGAIICVLAYRRTRQHRLRPLDSPSGRKSSKTTLSLESLDACLLIRHSKVSGTL